MHQTVTHLHILFFEGGVTSNIFTYIADGDLSLRQVKKKFLNAYSYNLEQPFSITMTSVATISALLLMPLNVWLYGRNLETNSLVIPYFEMCVTLVLVTIPVLIGLAANWRFPKYTPYITKLGVFSGFGIICFCQTLEIFIFPDIFFGVPARLYAAVFALPFVSFFAGFGFARVCGLNDKICRTIGIEIGIKNVGSALTIVSLSFAIQVSENWGRFSSLLISLTCRFFFTATEESLGVSLSLRLLLIFGDLFGHLRLQVSQFFSWQEEIGLRILTKSRDKW